MQCTMWPESFAIEFYLYEPNGYGLCVVFTVYIIIIFEQKMYICEMEIDETLFYSCKQQQQQQIIQYKT